MGGGGRRVRDREDVTIGGRERNVKMLVTLLVLQMEDGAVSPGMQQPPEAGKARGRLVLRVSRRNQSSETLIFPHEVHFGLVASRTACCLKLQILWSFVMAAAGNG